MNSKILKFGIPLLNFILCGQSIAQDLDLFQATDNVEERQDAPRRAQRNQETVTEPAFTLVGVSRFGDKYYASLKARNGKSVIIDNWAKNKVVQIDGYNDFAVADIGSRVVSIRYPENETCISNDEKGVKCNGNYALLTLSNAKPLAGRTTEEARQPAAGNEVAGAVNTNTDEETGTTIGNTNVLVRNPFSGELQETPSLTPDELAAREARRAQRAEQFRNFEIVRIPDDEIPAGMQRIRTPFGDRLEPEGTVDPED